MYYYLLFFLYISLYKFNYNNVFNKPAIDCFSMSHKLNYMGL